MTVNQTTMPSAEQIAELLQPVRWPLTAAYLAMLVALCVYGLHRYWLTWVFLRTRRRLDRPARRFSELPRVTIQLPLYNEPHVAERAIEAACAVDYPADRLQIQVLDDSTDNTAAKVRRCVARLAGAGHDIVHLQRTDRTGFKAGALQHGLRSATGEFVAVFDADFIAPRRFLKRTIHHFTDSRVGFVQACWQHLNRNASALTRSQAIFLDGHFFIEHAARCRSGRWMNFNGTAGVWRRTAIEDAGGWSADTLTEDVDLSYRAQLNGWRGVFLPHVQCPAELPPETRAFKSQQRRWAKGSVQVAGKLLGRIWRSPFDLPRKVEATFHLTSPLVYLVMVGTMLLTLPALFVNLQPFVRGPWQALVFGAMLFTLATASGASFYIVAHRQRRLPVLPDLVRMPIYIAVGMGIALSNAGGVIEALLGRRTPFVRTPKYRATGTDRSWRSRLAGLSLRTGRSQAIGELALAAYLTACVLVAARSVHGAFSVPFLLMFAGGYWYIGLTSLGIRPGGAFVSAS